MAFLKKHVLLTTILALVLISGLLILPQYLSRSMIIGSDALFHFNRFYDASMQLNERSYQPFISIYGFQQSGRVVNALYGPLIAYFHGLLVTISPTWFHYQLLGNFTLYLIAGLSMMTLLRSIQLKNSLCLILSVIFITTYAVQYWTIRQGFSSWGAALLPLGLLPLRPLIAKHTIKPLRLAGVIALVMETHLFSSLLLALLYLPFFGYAYYKSSKKIKFIRDLLLAIGLFFILTAHLWISMLDIYDGNQILAPFINQQMPEATLTAHSYYWLLNPLCLLLIIGYQFKHILIALEKLNRLTILTFGTALGFTVLATNLIPWTYLLKQDLKLVELIQFPFRFFIPATVLFLFSFGLLLKQQTTSRLTGWLAFTGCISLIQVIGLSYYSLNNWQTSAFADFAGKHTTITTDQQSLRDSFFQSDKTLSLTYWQKATPDYLPITKNTSDNYYDLYEELIINQQMQLKKTVVGRVLVIEWEALDEKLISLPVVLYNKTKITFNHRLLTPSDYELSTISTPRLTQKIGHNKVILTYHSSARVQLATRLSLISWLILLTLLGGSYFKKKPQTRIS